MAAFNLEKTVKENNDYRVVLLTTENVSQIVAMSLKPGEEIGLEKHKSLQFFRIESGTGYAQIGDDEYEIKDGSGVWVPGGTMHNIVNTSSTESIKLYTIYVPPMHKPFLVEKTKPKND